MARKIKGVFCERTATPKSKCARASFRWKRSGTAWILICCPKGKWDGRRKHCRVGTRAHKVLSRTRKGKRCPVGDKRVRK